MATKDDDEGALFREAMQGVTRLKSSGRAPGGAPPPSPRPRQTEADELAVMAEAMDGPPIDSGDELAYQGDGVQDGTFRKLKRGTFYVGDELDLHGLRADAARLEVAAFLARCTARGVRCVRIIHGKGLRSKGEGPVLKQRLDGWLRRRRDVLAFSSARPEHGGTGAVYVLLRSG